MEQRRRALIESHLPLVEHVVRKVTVAFPSFVDRQELLSAGRLGLTEAAERYDFDRSVPFGPYATRRIRGSVLDTLRSHDWVPRSVRSTARRADQAAQTLQIRNGRLPDEPELAEELGIEVAELRRVRSAAEHGLLSSLDARMDAGADNADVFADGSAPGPDEAFEAGELRELVRSAVHLLPERLRLIVVGHYLEGRSLEELAVVMGVTPSRVSQLRADAVEMIRNGIAAQFEPRAGAAPQGRAALRQAGYATAIARHTEWRARELAAARYREADERAREAANG